MEKGKLGVHQSLQMKLSKAEQTEGMMITWGRINQISKNLRTTAYSVEKRNELEDRLYALIEKFNEDLKYAKVDEEYFLNE